MADVAAIATGGGSYGVGVGKKALEFIFGRKAEAPQFSPLDINEIQSKGIAANQADLPAAQSFAASSNAFNFEQALSMTRKALEFASPGGLARTQSIVDSQLRGEIPQDIQDSVLRSGAARAFGTGTQGSTFSRNLTIRDLGLASLDIQQRGISNFFGLTKLAPNVALFDPTSMFFTPQQRLAFAVQERDNQFNRDWLAEQLDAAPSPVGKFIQNVVYAVAGKAGSALGAGMGGA